MIFLKKTILFLLILSLVFSCATIKNPYNSEGNNTSIPQSIRIPIKKRTKTLDKRDIALNMSRISQFNREVLIYEFVLEGQTPVFNNILKPIVHSEIISGKRVEITYFVSPNYFSLGTNSNYLICPTSPSLAQKIADTLNCMLPTKKMVDQIYRASTVKMKPKPIPPSDQMTHFSIFKEHNSLIQEQRLKNFSDFALNELTSGHKKDMIISNKIYRSDKEFNVVIYGWHKLNGNPIQPVYNGHSGSYVDYSHGFRFVHKVAYINGQPSLLSDILKSKNLHVLISNEGTIDKPYYPINLKE